MRDSGVSRTCQFVERSENSLEFFSQRAANDLNQIFAIHRDQTRFHNLKTSYIDR